MKDLNQIKKEHFKWKGVDFTVEPIPLDSLYETNLELSFSVAPGKKEKLKKAYDISDQYENLNLEHDFSENDDLHLKWYFHERDVDRERLIVRATHIIEQLTAWAA